MAGRGLVARPFVMKYRYLLGDSRREAARLRLQARLWDPVSLALFDRLRIRPGLRVLEVGPGEGSLHRELRRRVGGPVDAVERSAVFCRKLERLAARDGLGCGRIALQDYHRETWAMAPRPPEWGDFLAADRAFFATQGGDASVGSRLPDMFRRAGLRVVETVPTVKFGGPGSPVWNWPSSVPRNTGP
jgi:hypothetical protein